MRTKGVFLLALAGALCFALTTWAQDEEAALAAPPDHVSGDVLVRFGPKAPPAAVLNAAQAVGAQHVRSFDQLRIRHWRVGRGLTVQKALEILAKRPFIEFAEPNYVVHLHDVPDDPSFFQLWGLHNVGQLHDSGDDGSGNPEGQIGGIPDADIDAPEAWSIQKGSLSIVVGVVVLSPGGQNEAERQGERQRESSLGSHDPSPVDWL